MTKYLFDVPLTPQGRQQIQNLRNSVGPNKIILRGRHTNRKKLAQDLVDSKDPYSLHAFDGSPIPVEYVHSNLRRSVPLRLSERVAVYLKSAS
jgi:hypothetical protein